MVSRGAVVPSGAMAKAAGDDREPSSHCGSKGSNRAAGGRASPREARKHSRSARRPTRSSRTPSGPLWRLPPSPRRLARRCTAGRKPTPCTTPRQSRSRRARSTSAAMEGSTAAGNGPESAPISTAGPTDRRGRHRCGPTPPPPQPRAPRRPDGPGPAPAQSPPPPPGRSC